MRFFVCLVLLMVVSVARAENPVKLAAMARLDLYADETVGELRDGVALSAAGELRRMTWRKADEQPRGYSVMLPVSHAAWREFSFRFTPVKAGNVSLTLSGDWEAASPGVPFQQEVYWDGIQAEGATVRNGDFETPRLDQAPEGWWANGGRVQVGTKALSAAVGKQFARSWHNATLGTTLAVRAGVPVTIRLHARAVVPEGFRELERIVATNTPAHQAAKKFLRGTNFGNSLEVPPTQNWALPYSMTDLDQVRAEGFDHIRIPIGWHHYTGPAPEFTLRKEIFAKVDPLVRGALKRDLRVIINIHHFDEFTTNPAAEQAKFVAIWRQLAKYYADDSNDLAFELLNEPKDAATTSAINEPFKAALRVIREVSPERIVFIGPSKWNRVDEIPHLSLPADEQRVILTVHSYDPFFFTHQGASWTLPDTKLTGIVFPGPPTKPLEIPAEMELNPSVRDWIARYNSQPTSLNPCSSRAFLPVIQRAKEYADYYGRPIHFGEFGCFNKADVPSRVRFYREFRTALEDANMGWATWDWKAGFQYWDEKTTAPIPGMREALFGKGKTPDITK